MRAATPLTRVGEVVDDAEELAVKAAHLVAHTMDRTVDAVLSPLTVDVDLDDLTSNDDTESMG